MMDAHSEILSLCHGDTVDAHSLPDLSGVLHRAASGSRTILHISSEGVERRQTYRELAQQAKQFLGGLSAAGARLGDRIVLQIVEPDDLLAAIWACWLGGMVAVPIAVPPAYTAEQRKALQLQSILALLEAPWVVVSPSIEDAARRFLASGDRLLSAESLRKSIPQPVSTPSAAFASPDRQVLLLFTSGSTGQPKGVMLTEQNLRVSAYGMATVNRLTERSISLNWMPLEHVASLVMFHLTEVFVGCQQIHISNDYVLQDPLRWLGMVDRYRVTTTWAPNFAYGLINERADAVAQQPWDLSCLEWMGNGAEAVVAKTTRNFLHLLAPLGLRDGVVSPGYGMSETASGIVHSHTFLRDADRDGDAFVDVGTPIPGISLRIVDEQQQVVPIGTVGSLQVRGLTVTPGYYGRPDLNAEVFTADGWFTTGDLGFLQNGRLTITGRQKDMIILNGLNVYSHEIEAVVEELSEVDVSYTAACAVRRGDEASDRLAIFLHPSTDEIDRIDLVKTVRRQVSSRLGISPEYVIPVARAAIPKTALGKIQRSELSRRFQLGLFDDEINAIAALFHQTSPTKPPRNQLERSLLEIWQSVLGMEAIATDEQFFELGGSSLQLMQVLHQLSQQGFTLSAVDLFQHSTIASLAQFLAQPTTSEAVQRGQRRSLRRRQSSLDDDDIAVIGLGCRFPGAVSPAQFWQNLQDGVESITFFSDADILSAGVDPALVQHPDYVKASPILEDVERFDADFFGYSPREAELLDPQQRLMLECAWESLEDAGYDPFAYAADGGAIALYAGASMNSYLLNHVYPNRHRLDANDSLNVLTLSSMGGFQLTVANDKDYLATRVSYKLNLTGPSVNVQTACSTSLVTIHLACQSLLRGECDLALAGGVSVETPQTAGHLYQEGMILSPDGHCRAFDAQARGTLFGSGAGVVVLKRLKQAIADGDQIYAVVKGSAIGNDGSMKVGYLAPRAEGQATVISEALTIAGVEPDSITYVEAHGTGTALGDPIELAALTQAFRSGTRRNQFCALGSVKTNLGHLNVASGVVGFIKTVLCLHHRQLVPSLHFQTPNPQIDFANSPFFVNTALRNWETDGTPRRAGVNALGIGGTNAHIVLEESPPRDRPTPSLPERPLHVLALSAKTPTALHTLVSRYADFFAAQPDAALADVCFTANAGRSPFPHRLAIIAHSVANAQAQLQTWLEAPDNAVASSRPSLAFLFTGQGSQYAQMGHQLYDAQPVFRQAIDRCDQILQPELALSLRALLYGGPSALLQQTRYAQPALFAVEYALYSLWQSWGIRPDVVLGHSIGEYVAAWAAGVFSLEDALRLVAQRGRLMQAQPPGTMAAVFASVETVQSLLQTAGLEVATAAINGPQHTVISGEPAQVERAIAQLQRQHISVKRLDVSHAFHSAMMDPMVEEFRAIAATVRYSSPQLPVISNRTGTVCGDAIASPDYWCQQLRQPVLFAAGVEQLHQLGCDIALECGPKPVLTNIGRTLQPDSPLRWLPSLHPEHDSWGLLLQSLTQLYRQGATVDWHGFDQPYARQRLTLPTYPFQRQRYWLDATPTGAPVLPSRPIHPPVHPLLGQKIATPRATLFDGHLSLEALSYLTDHRIQGAAVFPGAAYLEMVLSAGAQMLSATPLRLENVVMPQRLVLDEDQERSLQLSLLPDPEALDPEGRLFEIHSGSLSAADQWTLHCRGTLTVHRDTAPIRDLVQLQHSFAVEVPWDERLRTISGLEYGARFRGVKQVWQQENSVLGWVQLPVCLESQAASYTMHPALLDACLQVVLALAPDQTQPYVPVSLARLQYYGYASTRLWSYAEVKEQSTGVLVTDVFLFDEHGKTVLTIAGLTSKAIAPHAWGQRGDGSRWLYQLEWQPVLRPAIPSSQYSGHWLIFADAQGIAQSLINQIEAARHSYTVVVPTGGMTGLGAPECVDPDAPDAFYRQVQNLSDRPLRGVIYIWGLDADTLTDASRAYTGALHLTQALLRANVQAPLWLITQGSQSLNIQPRGVAQAPLWGLGRTIELEHPTLKCRCVDVGDGGISGDRPGELLWAEVQADPPDAYIAFHAGQRYVAQLRPYAVSRRADDRSLQLQITERGSLENLVWQETERRSPNPCEIELRVLAAGLNFRDVLNALGRYPGDAEALGLECIGEVVSVGAQVQDFAVGDVVMAIAPGCLGQFVTIPSALAVSKPPLLSIAETATLPTAMLTADYALRVKSHLQPGDRLLIHAAAGGVGLAAVQLAQQVGAEIFATASPNKWAELQRRDVTHLYSSRSLEFATAIAQEIGEQSIDVVLNSLTGDFLLKSAALLSPGGRFIEIGKPNVDLVQRLRQLRPDIDYIPVDLMEVTSQQPNLIQAMLRRITQPIQPLPIQPLPHQLFGRDRIIDAFRTLQQAQHIGKVVIEFAQPTFSPQQGSVYVITGGLGGLGLQVAGALIDWGATHLLLLGRNTPTPEAVTVLAEWRQMSIDVATAQVDMADEAAVIRFFEGDRPFADRPIRGVFHAAGVLDDGTVENQTRQRFERVMAAKLQGAWALHRLSQDWPLDCFVLFSSAAALLGSAGQANYAAANAGLDALAHLRRSLGLPALSINWGAWARVGMASQGKARAHKQDRVPIDPKTGLAILNALLSEASPQVGVLPHVQPNLLTHSRLRSDVQWVDDIRNLPEGDRPAALALRLQRAVAAILGCDIALVDPEQGFVDLGLDSLTTIELTHQLQKQVPHPLPTALLYNYPTVTALTGYLVRLLDLGTRDSQASGMDEPSDEATTAIAQLTEDEATALLLNELERLEL